MRYPSLRRIVFVLMFLPIMLLYIAFCHLCLWLDHLLFFNFKNIKTNDCLFIIGTPKSGSNVLLQLIAKNENRFTSFRVWEMVFAPSILQKYILLFLGKIDRLMGRPFYKLWLKVEKPLFAKVKTQNPYSLVRVEEDEMLFMYIFYSVYLIYMFPELENQHDLAEVENLQNNVDKRWAMAFYKKCVQRHLYVFARNREKVFISKNPCYGSKLPALVHAFPNARYLYMQRDLTQISPYHRLIYQHLYRFFNTKQITNLPKESTKNMLEKWHKELQRMYQEDEVFSNAMAVDYQDLITHPKTIMQKMYQWLHLPFGSTLRKIYEQERIEIKAMSTF